MANLAHVHRPCQRDLQITRGLSTNGYSIPLVNVNRPQGDFPDVKKITLVCDNFNTHSIGAFYDTFEPGIARSLARRLDIVPTPKHGSWLNIAENELSALTAQCVKGRRFGTIEELREEVIAWANQCNAKQKGVDWQFTTDNARNKLRSLYPNF